MSAPFFPKDIRFATFWQKVCARLFGHRVATMKQHGMDIRCYRGVFYVLNHE
jgi:hypothetical protein